MVKDIASQLLPSKTLITEIRLYIPSNVIWRGFPHPFIQIERYKSIFSLPQKSLKIYISIYSVFLLL